MPELEQLAEQLKTLPPEAAIWLRDALLLLPGLLLGRRLRREVATLLASFDYESLRVLPWKRHALAETEGDTPDDSGRTERQYRLTRAAATASAAAVWLGTLWLIASLHKWPEAVTLLQGMLQVLLVLLLTGTLGLGLCHLVTDACMRLLLHTPLRAVLNRLVDDEQDEEEPVREPLAEAVARLCGVLVYAVGLTTCLLAGLEGVGWIATGSVLGSVWLLVLHFSSAAAVLVLGWIGLGWVRAATRQPERFGQKTGTAVVLAALLLSALSLPGFSATGQTAAPFGLGIVLLFATTAAVCTVAVPRPAGRRGGRCETAEVERAVGAAGIRRDRAGGAD